MDCSCHARSLQCRPFQTTQSGFTTHSKNVFYSPDRANIGTSGRAISYGGAYKVAHLRGCFADGEFAKGFLTRKASSWEALQMLGLPAHKGGIEAWREAQDLPEKKQTQVISNALDMELEWRSNRYAMPSEKNHVGVKCKAMLSLEKPTLESTDENAAMLRFLQQDLSADPEVFGEQRGETDNGKLDNSIAGDNVESHTENNNGCVTNGVSGQTAAGVPREGPEVLDRRAGAEPEGGLAWLQELSIRQVNPKVSSSLSGFSTGK